MHPLQVDSRQLIIRQLHQVIDICLVENKCDTVDMIQSQRQNLINEKNLLNDSDNSKIVDDALENLNSLIEETICMVVHRPNRLFPDQ